MPLKRELTSIAFTAIACSTLFAAPALAQTVKWIQQLGVSDNVTTSSGVATDKDGNVYIVGNTSGSLATNAGSGETYVAKYDTNGTVLWIRQFGTEKTDNFSDITTDKDGNVYIAGSSLEGNARDIIADEAFVLKYDTNGNLLWQKQFATDQNESAEAVATDKDGNVYLTGYIDQGFYRNPLVDAFLVKYDTNGNLLWEKQFATDKNDYSRDVATDDRGNVYITGSSNLESYNNPAAAVFDAFVAKYDTNGSLLWTQQLATTDWENSYGVATDKKENVYITGVKAINAYVAKYDTNGTPLWQQQLPNSNSSSGIDTDKRGNVYITGETRGTVTGTNAGGFDAYAAKYDTNGTLQWAQQFGSSGNDTPTSIATDKSENVYISGYTDGTLGAAKIGRFDAFVVKYEQ